MLLFLLCLRVMFLLLPLLLLFWLPSTCSLLSYVMFFPPVIPL